MRWALTLVATWALVAVAAAGTCGVAEHACRNARCVRLDQYCDGRDQCGDGSDEPPHCTVCNRTYYGHVGATYALAVGGAGEGEAPRTLPFLCHLTLTAGGGAHGDLVQIMFDEFRVGRYETRALDGCPDGYMQLSELGRPFTGGSWCGESAGYAVYYSETSTVTVSVKLFRARLGAAFHFRLRYKFIAQREAVVRFGSGVSPLERGAVSPGTYCTRTFEECHRKRCRLQSPNYPGMYPRNVTCYWSLRQKDIPTCKHAMIAVRQESAHKMQIKRSISMASLNKTGRAVRAWRDCTGERDRLIFYDGASTDDPVLVEYCGGDWLPPIVSRGPEMLVAFHSSPFSAPLHASTAPRGSGAAAAPAAPASPLRGFELDVDVIFADSDSLDYAREARRCEFHVKASSSEEEGNVTSSAGGGAGGGAGAGAVSGAGRGRRGRLHAPTHTLPPNTTCTWTFHGRPGDLVWIYFSSYTHYSLVEQRRLDNAEGGSTERAEGDAEAGPAAGAGAGASAGVGAGAGAGAGGSVGDGGRADSSPYARLREMLRARTPSPPRAAAPPRTPPPSRNTSAACATVLRIWDGGGEGEPEAQALGRYCGSPAVCARAALANATRAPRACAAAESYLSRSPLLALAARSAPGTATHPLRFSLHYEFVDTRQGGRPLREPRAHPPACARLHTEPGEVRSPRNVLWYGRGGARRLRCVYRVEAARGHRVALTLVAAAFGARPACVTRPHHLTARPSCVRASASTSTATAEYEWGEGADEGAAAGEEAGDEEERPRVAQLMIYESPWPGYRVPVACVCDEAGAAGAAGAVGAEGAALELELVVSRLRTREDHRHLHFTARWEPVPPPARTAAAPCATRRRLPPPGGRVYLTYPYTSSESECGETPYLLEARGNRSVFLRVWGDALPLQPPATHATHATPATPATPAATLATDDRVLCHTTNRILVYATHPTRLVKAICPREPDSERHAIHMFSENWYLGVGAGVGGGGDGAGGRALLVVWAGRAPGAAAFGWMEVWPAATRLTAAGAAGGEYDNATLAAMAGAVGAQCEFSCPELGACTGSGLWCDGVADCPRGGDERGAACGGARRLLARLGGARVAGGAAAALLAAGALGALALAAGARRRRRSPRPLPDKARLKEELLFGSRTSSTSASASS